MWWLLGCLIGFQTPDSVWRQWIDSRLQRDSGLAIQAAGNPAALTPLALQEYLLTLGQNGDPAGLEHIASFWEHDRVQGSAIFAYGEVAGAPIGPLLALEPRVRPQNRFLFAEALSKLATAEEAETLFQVWKRFSPSERDHALFFFWRNKPEPLTEAVIAKLQNSPRPEDRGYVYYLYRSRTPVDPGLIADLVPVFGENGQALIYLTRVAAARSDAKLEERMAALCFHGDWRVRVNAVNALREPEWKRSRGLAMLSDPNPNVVRAALAALVSLNDADVDHNLTLVPHSFSACQIQSLIDGAGEERYKRFLPLAHGWLDSEDPWRHRKALANLGKVGGDAAVTRLRAEISHTNKGEAAIALGALKQVPGAVDSALLEAIFSSGDPYLMAGGLEPVAEDKVSLSKESLLDLVTRTYEEPDFQYGYLDRVEKLAPATSAARIRASLLDHDQYLVRLKALAVSPEPGTAMRRQVFQKPWQSKVPREVSAQAAQWIKGGEKRLWLLQTAKGEIEVLLRTAYAPITCANIAYLSKNRYFDGMPIHRVVPNFVVQAGDVRGDGSGGPGYSIPCEINTLRYRRGSVGMALAGKDTGGSQFFICHSDQPHLDGGYTVFGEVTSGMEVVDRLEEGDLILSSAIQTGN